jgi:predicted amidophosphoribosyltransferase
MIIENKKMTDNNFIMVNSREQGFVTCPHCWTDQRADRDFCYRCGAVFIYKDELKDEAEEEQAGRALTRSA